MGEEAEDDMEVEATLLKEAAAELAAESGWAAVERGWTAAGSDHMQRLLLLLLCR